MSRNTNDQDTITGVSSPPWICQTPKQSKLADIPLHPAATTTINGLVKEHLIWSILNWLWSISLTDPQVSGLWARRTLEHAKEEIQSWLLLAVHRLLLTVESIRVWPVEILHYQADPQVLQKRGRSLGNGQRGRNSDRRWNEEKVPCERVELNARCFINLRSLEKVTNWIMIQGRALRLSSRSTFTCLLSREGCR